MFGFVLGLLLGITSGTVAYGITDNSGASVMLGVAVWVLCWLGILIMDDFDF